MQRVSARVSAFMERVLDRVSGLMQRVSDRDSGLMQRVSARVSGLMQSFKFHAKLWFKSHNKVTSSRTNQAMTQFFSLRPEGAWVCIATRAASSSTSLSPRHRLAEHSMYRPAPILFALLRHCSRKSLYIYI